MEDDKLTSGTNGDMSASINEEDANLLMTPLILTSDEESNFDLKNASLLLKSTKKDTKSIRSDLEDDIKEIFGEKKTKNVALKNTRKSSTGGGGAVTARKSPIVSSVGKSPIRIDKIVSPPLKKMEQKGISPEPSTSFSSSKRSHSQMESVSPPNEKYSEYLYGFDDDGGAVLGPSERDAMPLAKKIKDDMGNNYVEQKDIDMFETNLDNAVSEKTPMVIIENPPEMKDKMNGNETKSQKKINIAEVTPQSPSKPIKDMLTDDVEKSTITVSQYSSTSNTNIAQTTNSASASKIKPSVDLIYRKPFEMGWKREIVLRALPGSKDKGEIYYITPNGKKLRTRNEIQSHLTPGLTLDNFTLRKDPLGANPDEEIIRNAKITGRTSDVILGKRVPKPKAPKGASPPPSTITSSSSSSFSQNWLSSGNKNSNKSTTVVDRHHHNSSAASSPRLVSNTRISEDGGGSRSSSKSSSSKSNNKKGEPCTIQCVLAMGMIPQLQCVKCLCLYHHECVGLDRNDDGFRLNSPITGPTKILHDGSGCGDNIGGKYQKDYECTSCKIQLKLALPEVNNLIKSPTILNQSQSLPSNSTVNIDKQTSRRSSIKDLKSTGQKININSCSGISGSITNSQQNLIINTSNNDLNIEKSSKMPQSIAVLNGRKYLVIRKPGATAATEIENDSVIQTESNHSSSSRRRPNSSGLTSASNAAPNNSTKIQKVDTFANNFFGNVSMGYDILLQIFQYLKVQELLRAACVCRVWNVVANHRTLWKTVRMKNSQVNDWSGLAASLRRNETQHLDLRKMLCLNSPEDQMWSNFAEHIKSVVTLQTIDLGRCSSEVVQNLFLTAPQLHHLNAISIRSETLNLTNLNNMKNLEELRLKTNDGFRLEGDLSPFEFLINLRHLSLTSITELGLKNIEILGNLINLESLEIGECSNLPNSFAIEILPKLIKLQRLRLEKSTETSVTFEILNAIAIMENLTQLELVNFDIRDGFETRIIACKHLKRLLLIPTYISQSATTNQIILSSMRKFTTLNSLTWVVTMELLRVTALYVDQCEAGTKDKKTFDESIPVLKPVPGTNYKDDEQSIKATTDIQQVEILPLSKIKEILAEGMPNTKFKILKVAYHATWRQNYVE